MLRIVIVDIKECESREMFCLCSVLWITLVDRMS